jgi:hypothetical protein
MAKKNSELYLYLARRDKTGVRIIATLSGNELFPTRLELAKLGNLNLPQTWYKQIYQIMYDSRMLWEPWIQSVEDFQKFRADLKKRGFSKIPVSNQPEFTNSTVQTQMVNTSFLPQSKTMLR